MIYIAAGVDFKRVGDFRMQIVEATGPSTFTVLIDENGLQHADSSYATPTVVDTSPRWCHEDLSTVLADYDDLAGGLKAALDAGSAAEGGMNGWTYTVTYSRAAQTYTISAAEGNTALTFNDTATQFTLGFSSLTSSSAASHTGDTRPWYSVIPEAGALSSVRRPRPRGGFIHGAVTSAGFQYAIGPSSLARFCEMAIRFESTGTNTPASAGTPVFATDAQEFVPWTYEDFVDHVSAIEPFRIDDGTHDWVVKLEPEAAHFDPERAEEDWDMWHLRFRALYLGAL